MQTKKFRIYKWFIECFQKHRYITFQNFREYWDESDYIEDRGPLSERQFHRFKNDLRKNIGIDVQCLHKGDFLYYIANPEVMKDNDLTYWMINTLSMGEKMRECIALKEYIKLEPISTGGKNLDIVTDSMLKGVKIEFGYRKYGEKETTNRELGVCGLVLYHNKWYMIGDCGPDTKRTFALDRMHNTAMTDNYYKIDSSFDVNEYFSDIYGIFNTGSPKIKITLRAFDNEKYVMRNLPIHHSQREVASGDGYADFEITVRPNNELISYILSRKTQLKVLSPDSFVKEFAEAVTDIQKLYFGI